MELNHYFTPVDFGQFRSGKSFARHSLGWVIEKDTTRWAADFRGRVRVALVGVPHTGEGFKVADYSTALAFRRSLYGLVIPRDSAGVIDLGDFRPGKSQRDLLFALRDVIDYLSDEGISVVVMGGGQELDIGICRAFIDREDFVFSVIDAAIDLKTGREVTHSGNFLSRVLKDNPGLFHLQMIATQAPLVPLTYSELFFEKGFDICSLGSLRDNMEIAEPLLRHTHFLSFDMAAIKGGETGSFSGAYPNGLNNEEACRLARFAGLSSSLEVFSLTALSVAGNHTELEIALGAQIIWYYLEARAQRRNENPGKDESLFTRFFVETEILDKPLGFFHHGATNRWWIEVSDEDNRWIIPCLENDYLIATRGEIPEVWWKFARKLSIYQNNRKLNSFFAKQ